MKKLFIFLAITFLFGCHQTIFEKSTHKAPSKEIALEDFIGTSFTPQRMNSLNSMNGDYYSILNKDKNGNSTIDKYHYSSLKKVATVVDGKNLEGVQKFSTYHFNKDETKVILGKNIQPIYRRSSKGTYYVLSVETQKLHLIDNEIQEPTFSPDGQKIAYAKNNNLFILDLRTHQKTQVTKNGAINAIINGISDWVYEEEFGFVRAFEWNANSSSIAFLRFDESQVREFSMGITGNQLYPQEYVFKYPKAGEKNAKVTLHVYHLKNRETKKIELKNYEYIPRIKWSNETNVLIATTLNRRQNDLKLLKIETKKGKVSLLLNEKDEAYVSVNDHLTFLDDNSFIWTSEKDGYNHLYHYNFEGNQINQITQGNWEVTKYYGYDAKRKRIYYQSVENGNTNRGVYGIDLNGKNKQLLSHQEGYNEASFSSSLNYFINNHSSSKTPPNYSLYSAEGTMLKVIIDNSDLKNKLIDYSLSPKEFSTIEINGNDLNMWMIKPPHFDENKKYPLLMFQYSGPGSQKVVNRWHDSKDYWHQLLAQKDVVIACIDGRGTGFKGRDFKKITQKELGKYEVEDQIAAAKKLTELSFIDRNRIGIWGWSYGGFMSTNCLLKGNDIFSTAIAVAPVTSWRFYDTVYTERYMQTPQENPSGYDDNSPINYADQLKGNYLLVHGTGDDNVHVQNSMRMINALVEANKPFEIAMYPDRAHGIRRGKNTQLHLYKKMTAFLEKNLIIY